MTDTQLLRPSPQQMIQQRAEADLKANQTGVLSARQRWRYVAVRAAEHGIGALTMMLIFAVLVNALQLAPDLVTIGVVAFIIFVGTLLFLLFNIRPAFEAKVKSTKGALSRSVISPPLVQPFFCLAVGNTLFYLQADDFDSLDDDDIYEAYYLERPARVGGHVLLSLRQLSDLPDNVATEAMQ